METNMETTFQFTKGQLLRVDGTDYEVQGGIEFYNTSDGSLWQEFRIRSIRTSKICWLSIDNVYGEYAIYEEQSYHTRFEEQNITQNGYHQVDDGIASVRSCFGVPDTSPNDSVHYTEYEDSTEEKIISIERWEDATEYSIGYYLDWDEITVLDNNAKRSSSGSSSAAGFVFAVCILFFIIFIAFIVGSVNSKSIAKHLKNSSYYTYETSITSDLNSREKADVYETSLSVADAAKDIIDAIEGDTESVQESDEDDSVAILTKREYCLVYTDTDGITLVQISSRAYAYQSTNSPYHSSHHTRSYYRRFYYSYGYYGDHSKYSGKTSGYENFTGDDVTKDYSDPYNSYSSSVRQSSINSRSSSGGGISSGK